ncbi:hypothetical protein BIV60_00765 [Bacillus sp. MUM 116]|uniref:DUF1798 family protein n=1 Tax=Bacillus sp. MUM 116 TaxID=1678002 RepID=UPI0008F5D34B|nr:DUF1798 family protein [Bacillus sp. MUM 116]OIK17090.1 hypothetical protein BIV60_00765 [Bacillus sp. MUM 116]
MKEQLSKLTLKLLHYNQICLNHYQNVRETGIKQDFYQVIKPFADEVKAASGEWKKLTKNWLRENERKHIHEKQIDLTAEHLSDLSIQAFFPETSRTRLTNTNRTVEYFLTAIVKELGK